MNLKQKILIFFCIIFTYTPQTRTMQPATKQEYAWLGVGIGIGAFAATVGTYFLHKRTKNKWRQEMVNFESETTAQKDTYKLQLQQSEQEKSAALAENTQLKTALEAYKKSEPPPTPSRVSALARAQELDAQEKEAQKKHEKEKALQNKHHHQK